MSGGPCTGAWRAGPVPGPGNVPVWWQRNKASLAEEQSQTGKHAKGGAGVGQLWCHVEV